MRGALTPILFSFSSLPIGVSLFHPLRLPRSCLNTDEQLALPTSLRLLHHVLEWNRLLALPSVSGVSLRPAARCLPAIPISVALWAKH